MVDDKGRPWRRETHPVRRFANPLYHHHHLLTHTNDRTPRSTCADSFRPPTTHTTHAIEPPIHTACTVQPPHRLWPGCPPVPLLLPPSPSCLIRAAQHDDNSGGGMLAASTFYVRRASGMYEDLDVCFSLPPPLPTPSVRGCGSHLAYPSTDVINPDDVDVCFHLPPPPPPLVRGCESHLACPLTSSGLTTSMSALASHHYCYHLWSENVNPASPVCQRRCLLPTSTTTTTTFGQGIQTPPPRLSVDIVWLDDVNVCFHLRRERGFSLSAVRFDSIHNCATNYHLLWSEEDTGPLLDVIWLDSVNVHVDPFPVAPLVCHDIVDIS